MIIMNEQIRYIAEGFFGNRTANINRTKSIIDTSAYGDELKQKLLNRKPISADEWDFINSKMDGCVLATNDTLQEICWHYMYTYDMNISLNWIDTSGVTNMEKLFHRPYDRFNSFNPNISKWDVSNVVNMYYMFTGASSFTGDISNWDVSNVRSMRCMFEDCRRFHGDLSRWDVSNVTDMVCMFKYCRKFNCDLSRWDVSNVTDMIYMFQDCKKFQSDLSRWDVSKVTKMAAMFFNCKNFNSDLSQWNVSNVKYADDIFAECPIRQEFKPKFKC